MNDVQRVMTDQEFAEIIALGHETRSVESKGPGRSSNRQFMAVVVRAVLGMTNRRDGGRVIIGVEEGGEGTLDPVGVDATVLDTWRFDDVAARISEYADPSVEFGIEAKEYNGDQYLSLHIEEFTDIPVLCKKDYPEVLRSGACYVRSRRKPETSEIPTQTDMRELLDLATEKGLNKWVAQAQQAGVIVFPQEVTLADDQQRFDEQLGDLR